MTRTHFATNGHATAGIDAALTQIAQTAPTQTTEDMNAALRIKQAGMNGTMTPRESDDEAPMVIDATFITPQGRAADTESLSRVMARIYAPLAWGSVGAFCAVLVMLALTADCVGC
jgi:exonuclease I